MNSIKLIQKRLLATLTLVTFIFVVIVFRLFSLQVVKSQWLTAKAAEQWYRDLPLQAKRGNIVDTNGLVLAKSYSTYDVYVKPNRVKEREKVAYFLSSTLGLAYENVLSKVSNMLVSESLIKAQVDNLTSKKIIDAGLDGVVLSENSKRFYPYGNMLTQVLGFTTIDNIGQSGLEATYEKYLKGINGYALEESDVNGVKIDNTLSRYIPSISGMDLELTIDANIQLSLESALNLLMIEQKPLSATGIVMNPNTGEIIAMSTKPSYDLNNLPRNDVETLLKQARNISVVDVYEPGSTFKVLTTATSLEYGVAT
ncbi:MAG: stage V sporulation protein D, partial [Clostridia bacterium]|nr:stage V sporulation protein D [Clostridia bacterium]